MVDFSTLLSVPTENVERPVPMPAGTYQGIIKKYTLGETSGKKTPYVRFTIGQISAEDDVDAEAIATMDLSSKELEADFYLGPKSNFRIVDLAASCGQVTEGESIGSLIEAVVGQPVLATVEQRPSQDGTRVYSQVRNVVGTSA